MTKLPLQTEASFTKQVLDLAKLCGWRTAHFRPARTSKGWRTAVQGDGVGFPDVLLVRESLIIFAELKTDKGRLSFEQRNWLEELKECSAIRVFLWRPSDWDKIVRVLE